MKRSEIVRLISDTIWGNTNFHCVEDCDILSSKILKNLQDNGMLPPWREKIENGRFVGTSNVNHPSWDEE